MQEVLQTLGQQFDAILIGRCNVAFVLAQLCVNLLDVNLYLKTAQNEMFKPASL